MTEQIRIGLPRMHKEKAERRDFLPIFVGTLASRGAQVMLEEGYGAGMGFSPDDYRSSAPAVSFGSYREVFEQDVVLVVRYPSDEAVAWMRPGACLMSMIHYPTRPNRIEQLRARGVEAFSLDSIKDDSGRRIVENMHAVAWNGMEVAFQTLRQTYPYPGLESPSRLPVNVTLLGVGAVGAHVLQAAVHYGDPELRKRLADQGIPGVKVTAVDYDMTGHETLMLDILTRSDILVDATQRPDPSLPVIPNGWLAYLPEHAVILDLSVDPYECSPDQFSVKSIEGIPQGSLDQVVFPPDDPAFDRLPGCVDRANRRHVVSCYSWPGIHPEACMQVYGEQLQPLMGALITKGGPGSIHPNGSFFERALAKAQLSRWPA